MGVVLSFNIIFFDDAMLRYVLERPAIFYLKGHWPFSYDVSALSIRGHQEMKPRHAPRLSVAVRGSVEIIKLLLYYVRLRK